MIKNIVFYLLITLVLLSLSGCLGRSPEPHFYTLTSLLDTQVQQMGEKNQRKISIGVGPIKIAEYLNQNRIITRTKNSVNQAEYDQWSGSLINNLTNVLAENIGHLLKIDSIFLFPWRSNILINYQVTVDIVRFDGELGGDVVLIARWSIFKGVKKDLVDMKRSEYRIKTTDSSYNAFVKGQSHALAKLCSDIVTTITVSMKK